jgi:hypothetical protein
VELVFDRTRLKEHLIVGRGSLANAAASDEYLGLQHPLAFPRLALDVVKGVAVFDGCVESEDHGGAP